MSLECLSGLRALVTGGGGFLGSHLCARLLASGAAVHATSRTARPSDGAGVRWWRTDLTDAAQVTEMLYEVRPDVVYHLAGQVTAAPELECVLPTFHSLLASTVNVLTAATRIPCRRIILTGSLTEPEAAGDLAVPSSPYAAAKWSAGGYARMFHKLYGAPIVILRPYMTFGPRQHESKLIPHVIDSLLCGSPPRISSGGWSADWIYIDDVIDGFLAAARHDAINGLTIDLGTGQMTTIRDIVGRLIQKIDPRIEPLYGAIADRPAEQVRSADVQASQRALGWSARTSLDEGLTRTIDWHRRQAAAKTQGYSP